MSVPNKYAAEEAGIDEDTFASWMRKGREGHAPYEEFYQAVTRARASAVRSLTIRVLGGGKGSSGSAWLLERRFANDYGPRQRLELSEDPERPLGNVRAALDGMSIEQVRKLAE